MIKTQVKTLVVANDVLKRLFDQGKTKNVKLLFRLMLLKKAIADYTDVNSVYTLTRNKILEKYIVDPQNPRDFKGETPEEQTENGTKFYEEMNEFGETEVEFGIELFSMEDLEGISMEDPLTPTELFSLAFLLNLEDLKVDKA